MATGLITPVQDAMDKSGEYAIGRLRRASFTGVLWGDLSLDKSIRERGGDKLEGTVDAFYRLLVLALHAVGVLDSLV